MLEVPLNTIFQNGEDQINISITPNVTPITLIIIFNVNLSLKNIVESIVKAVIDDVFITFT